MICGKCVTTMTRYLVPRKYLKNFLEIRELIADSINSVQYDYYLLLPEPSEKYEDPMSQFVGNASKTRRGTIYSAYYGMHSMDRKELLNRCISEDFCQCPQEEKGDGSICLHICDHKTNCKYHNANGHVIRNAFEINRRKGKFILTKRFDLTCYVGVVDKRRLLEEKWGLKAQTVGFIFYCPSGYSLPHMRKFTKIEDIKSFLLEKIK